MNQLSISDFYDLNKEQLTKILLNNDIPRTTDEDEIDELTSDPLTAIGSTFYADFMRTPGENASEETKAVPSPELEKYEQLNPGIVIGGTNSEYFPEITGETNTRDIFLNNEKINKKGRVSTAFRLGQEESGDTALWHTADRFLRRNDIKLDPDSATEYARSFGVDIKYTEPKSMFEVEQGVSILKNRRDLERDMATYYSTGDMGFLNNAYVTAAMMAGSIGPLEIAANVGAAFIPGGVTKGIATGAGKVEKALNLKKVLDAGKAVQKAKTAEKILSATGASSSIYYKSGSAIAKAAELEARNIKLAKTLRDASGITYDTLTPYTKMGGDMLSVLAVDVPFILTKKENSDALEIGIYSERDKAVETLLATGGGAFLPYGIRKIGEKLGIGSKELISRKLDLMENDIKYKKAMGETTPEKANKQLEAINNIRKNEEEINKLRREPNKYLEKMAVQLKQAHISDKSMMEYKMYVYNTLKQGNIPDPKKAPMGELFFTSLHSDYFRKLANGEHITDIFAGNIHKKSNKKHITSIKILGEYGYLGKHYLSAIDDKDAMTAFNNMYRGYVLNDKESFNSFKQWVTRSHTFTNELERILDEYKQDYIHNARKGTTKKSAEQLMNVRQRLEKSFYEYKLGKEEADRVRAGETSDRNEVREEFKSFYEKYVTETKNKKGDTLYDFIIDDESKKSPSKSRFAELIKELKEAQEDNSMLDLADDYYAKWDENSKLEYINTFEQLDVPSHTNRDMLFGTPFRTYDEAVALDKKVEHAAFVTEIEELKFVEAEGLEDITRAKSLYEKNAANDPNIYNHSKKAIECLDAIKEAREAGFVEIKQGILDRFKKSIKLQEHVRNIFEGKGVWNYAIELNFREALEAGLSASALKALTNDLDDIVKFTVEILEKEIETNPAITKALLTLENLKDVKEFVDEVGEFTFDLSSPEAKALSTAQRNVLGDLNAEAETKAIIQNRQKMAEIQTAIDVIFAPMDKAINYKLNVIKNRYMHDLNVGRSGLLVPMLKNPEVAPEVITGKANQTIYAFEGSNLSVEYKAKDSVFFERSLRNKLNTMESSQKGKKLVDVLDDESETEKIMDAMLDIQFENKEAMQVNTDASRIGSEIMDHLVTAFPDFIRFGSEYVPTLSVFDNTKIKEIDALVSDTEMRTFFNETLEALDSEELVNNILKNIDENEGKFLVGKEYKTKEEVSSIVKNNLSEIKKAFEGANDFKYDLDKKLLVLAFRDLNLDLHFDKRRKVKVSLNKMRDAILEGRWENLLEGDAYKLVDATSDLKFLLNELVGKVRLHGDGSGALMPDATKWIYGFRTGFNNISAVREGSKSAYLDALDNRLVFKDKATTMKVWRVCGEKNLKIVLHNNFDAISKAYYSLENFGSRPWPIAEEAIHTFNRAVKDDPELANRLVTLAESKGISDPVAKFSISPGAQESAKQNLLLVAGLQNRAPSAWVRFIKATQTILASPLLFKAGFKSLSDHATIWEGLMTNAYVDNRAEAFALTTEVSKFILQNPDEAHMILAAGIVQQDDILKTLLNDPAADILNTSKNISALDRYETFSRQMADLCLNKMAHISDITNFNKQVAALAIQRAMANHASIAYKDLPDNYKLALDRVAVSEADWDFMRKNLVHGVYEDLGAKKEGDPFQIFDPYRINKITDKQLAIELEKRGTKVITQEEIDKFRNELISKSWVLVDSAADEMVSLPSGRVLNWMRGGRARNTGWGTVIETLTQFQSFGAALLYNTYGKKLANFAARETGVTLIDLFNPHVKLNHATRPQIYASLLASFATVATTMIAVDSVVNATTGSIDTVVDSEGKVHLDGVLSSASGALGFAGTMLNSIADGITGSGQRGGGFSVQVAPSVSNALRIGYRITKPLRSSEVEDRTSAVSAAVAQEVARASGLRTLPFIGLFWQAGIGSWLDFNAAGSVDNYEQLLRNREERGQLVLPFERNPMPFWDRL